MTWRKQIPLMLSGLRFLWSFLIKIGGRQLWNQPNTSLPNEMSCDPSYEISTDYINAYAMNVSNCQSYRHLFLG